MKLAVIAPSALPSRRANAIQTARMANAFARLGHEVLLMAYPPRPRSSSLSPSLSPVRQGRQAGWEVLAEEYGLDSRFEVCWLSARQWARRYDYAWQAVWQARGWRAEGIFTRLPQAAALASLLGKTTFFEAHDLPRHAAAKWFRLFLLGKGARRTIAISQALANDLLETFPTLRNFSADFLLVLGDGVDLTHYTPLLSPLQARQKLRQVGWELPDGFIAGYTGHLYRGRGSDMMIALADALREVHFLIVGGEIEQCHSLMQEFKARGLTNYTLTGPVIPLQVPLFQMASNVLLMPYQAQVAASSGGDIARYLSPLKLFEYLASARPILASDLAVFREILTDENAILLPPQELGAWEAALVMLLRNPQRCSELAEGARHTAEQHTWERRAERILSPA